MRKSRKCSAHFDKFVRYLANKFRSGIVELAIHQPIQLLFQQDCTFSVSRREVTDFVLEFPSRLSASIRAMLGEVPMVIDLLDVTHPVKDSFSSGVIWFWYYCHRIGNR